MGGPPFKVYSNDTTIERPIDRLHADPTTTAPAMPIYGAPVVVDGFRLVDARASYGIGLQTFALGFPMHFDWSWRTLFNKDWEDVLFAQAGGSSAFRKVEVHGVDWVRLLGRDSGSGARGSGMSRSALIASTDRVMVISMLACRPCMSRHPSPWFPSQPESRDPPPVTPKRWQDSATETVQVVLPNDSNPLGFILGGTVMHLIDITGAIACHRHTNSLALTAAVDGLEFVHTIRVGDMIILKSRVTGTFTTRSKSRSRCSVKR